MHPHLKRFCWFIFAVALVGCCFPRVTRACDGIPCADNLELFDGAKLVYEAELLSWDFNFKITRTWRGEPRERIVLEDTGDFPDPCRCGGSFEVGSAYLLVVYCDVPKPDTIDVFDCRAYAEPVGMMDSRLEFLRYGHVLTPRWLSSEIADWVDGKTTNREFADWLMQEIDLAEVDDWTMLKVRGGEERISPTASVLWGLYGFFDENPDCRGEKLEAVESFKTEIVPVLVEYLDAPEEVNIDAVEDQLAARAEEIGAMCSGELPQGESDDADLAKSGP